MALCYVSFTYAACVRLDYCVGCFGRTAADLTHFCGAKGGLVVCGDIEVNGSYVDVGCKETCGWMDVYIIIWMS